MLCAEAPGVVNRCRVGSNDTTGKTNSPVMGTGSLTAPWRMRSVMPISLVRA
jgi:hypothetical protein